VWHIHVTIVVIDKQQCILCIVEAHVTFINIEILSFAQQCFHCNFMSSETIRAAYAFQQIAPYFCANLAKFFRLVFIKVSNIKFHGHSSRVRRADTCGKLERQTEGRTDGRTDGHDEDKRGFWILCETRQKRV
jgi:hypothetical protein